MRRQVLYLVFSALIALNAAVCLSWAFSVTIHSYVALVCYVAGFSIISFIAHVTHDRENNRDRVNLAGRPMTKLFSAAVWEQAADAVDPSVASPGKLTTRVKD